MTDTMKCLCGATVELDPQTYQPVPHDCPVIAFNS